MKVIKKDLYYQIFELDNHKIKQIKILVGYASANFLEKIIEEIPNAKIDLIIGMALDGISKEDHEKYKIITKKYNNIDVYYRVNQPKSHIKLYVINNEYSYVGSANFSNVAFKSEQHELLIRTNDTFSDIINSSLINSCICTDELGVSSIPFYTDNLNIPEENKKIVDSQMSDDNSMTHHKLRTNNLYIRRTSWELVDSIKIIPVLFPENDPQWDIDGINISSKNGLPHLIAPNSIDFKEFFRTTEFDIFVDNKNSPKKFRAYLGGNFNKRLYFEDTFNIYNYIKKYTDVIEERPLSYQDLLDSKIKHIKITRLNESEYFLEVIKK